jgi:hypothetical protein
LVIGQPCLFFDQQHLAVRVPLLELVQGGCSDNAASDDHNVECVGLIRFIHRLKSTKGSILLA